MIGRTWRARPTTKNFATMMALIAAAWLGLAPAYATECPEHPGAIGTSRTIVVDPAEHPRIGTMQYPETLPLEDHEVVLTFDDGPLPAHTNAILDILAAQCVKATFFMVGRMAHDFPQDVRRVHEAGHTIGTHSQNHPFRFGELPPDRMTSEIEDAIANVGAALGDASAVAPFFRIPGLRRAEGVETYLAKRGIMTWSADFPADDWRHISSAQVVHLALSRLEAKGKGVLLLHDIQARTQAALPTILQELKARGYRIVHVVPATPERPKTPTEPGQWVPHWSHGPGPIAKGLAGPRFMFGEADDQARGAPSSMQSVRLAHVQIPIKAGSFGASRSVSENFTIYDALEVRSHANASLARIPGAWPVAAGDLAFRLHSSPIRIGSRVDSPTSRNVR